MALTTIITTSPAARPTRPAASCWRANLSLYSFKGGLVFLICFVLLWYFFQDSSMPGFPRVAVPYNRLVGDLKLSSTGSFADSNIPTAQFASSSSSTVRISVTNSSDVRYKEVSQKEVTFWVDVPNAFPWRKCLFEFDQKLHTYPCVLKQGWEREKQKWTLDSVEGDNTKFKIRSGSGKCLEPFTDKDNTTVVRLGPCGSAPARHWRWSSHAHMEWSMGGCMASTGGQALVNVVPCNNSYEDQNIEVGVVRHKDKDEMVLEPLDSAEWAARQKVWRDAEMEDAARAVKSVLDEIRGERDGPEEEEGARRRAVVFYVDKGGGFLAYLTWWLFTWRTIGLSSAEEAFDIVLMVHPLSVDKLPDECVKVYDDFDPRFDGPGRCVYKVMLGISYRDHRYDNYLNSQECLFSAGISGFLRRYKLLMRADLDTFPTPRMIGYWPDRVICNRNAGTNWDLDNIATAIREAAAAVGIEHKGWANTDSAWYGPARRVIHLSKLTVALARFTRVFMFGPNTHCRCATCIDLPKDCEWGSGPYAGTLLLYAQEIAMNELWSQEEYDSMTYGMLDQSTTEKRTSVCRPAVLHARHNPDPFSKFSFLRGDYTDMKLDGLDITNVQDYSVWLAVTSAGQGVGSEAAMKRYKENLGGIELRQLCKSNSTYMANTYGEDWRSR